MEAFAERIDPIVDRTLITFKSGLMAEKSFKTKMLIIASSSMPEIENYLIFERSIENEKKLSSSIQKNEYVSILLSVVLRHRYDRSKALRFLPR